MITIINYDAGNLRSVINAFDYLGIATEVTNDKKKILDAKKILLPGVGSFRRAIENIKSLDIFDSICEATLVKKTPILGICLGMQLLAKSSDEDKYSEGFGFIDGEIKKFNLSNQFQIPHVGFNSVQLNSKNSQLFSGIEDNSDFYFVHSFRLENSASSFVSGTTEYGEKFTAAFEQNNIFGAQFHPEKSQSNGLKMLHNFSKI